MSDNMRINGNTRVDSSYENYNTPVIGQNDDFKKKMNSIHVPYAQVAYMPAGGIGNLLGHPDGNQTTTGGVQA